MAEARKYNSKLNSKGLEASVSEDQARHMATHQGHNYVFIVQAHSGPKTVAEDGNEVVSLIADLVELVPEAHEERVRELQRAFYLARPDQHGQAAFETGDGEPTIEQALTGVSAIVDRDDDGQPTDVWDGNPDTAAAPVDKPWPGDPDFVKPGV